MHYDSFPRLSAVEFDYAICLCLSQAHPECRDHSNNLIEYLRIDLGKRHFGIPRMNLANRKEQTKALRKISEALSGDYLLKY